MVMCVKLSPQLKDFQARLGDLGLLLLLQNFGGENIYVPKTYSRPHRLEILGADLYAKLCREFGGCTLQIPLGSAIKQRNRNFAIYAARQHHTEGAVARSFRLSPRRVRQICQQMRDENASAE